MRSPHTSLSRFQFESATLGSNEEFLRLHYKFMDSVRDYNRVSPYLNLSSRLKTAQDRLFEFISQNIKTLDKLLKKAEKIAQLHELVAGIAVLIEQLLFPAVKKRISEVNRLRFVSPISSKFAGYFFTLETLLQELCAVFTNSVASGLESAYNVVVSAVVLLALVYQYLLGCVDKGGSKTYSSGSLDFRDSFVCIVLYRGAYVWIKFRQAACPANRRKRKSLESPRQASPFGSHDEPPVSEGGVYRRAVRDKKSGTVTHFKYEPRFKPPRERLDSGTTLKFNCLSLGSYDTDHEARIVRQIAAFYYGKEEGHVQLEDGLCVSIPSMSEQEKSLSGKEKAKWVTSKTKAVYADLLEGMERQRVQLLNPALRTNSQVGGATIDPIQFAEIEACAALGTYGSELASLPDGASSLASDQFDWISFSAGSEDMIDELSSVWTSVPALQSSGLDNQRHTGGVTDIVPHRGGCLPQDLEHREPQVASPPTESPHGQVNYLQQLVACYKNKLQDVQHQLMECEVQKSNLEHQLMGSEAQNSELQRVVENFKIHAATCTVVPNSRVATWSSFITDVDIQSFSSV